MKEKDKLIKTTEVYRIEADSIEEAKELASDKTYLLSQVIMPGVEITDVKCTSVEETEDLGYFELTCDIYGVKK